MQTTAQRKRRRRGHATRAQQIAMRRGGSRAGTRLAQAMETNARLLSELARVRRTDLTGEITELKKLVAERDHVIEQEATAHAYTQETLRTLRAELVKALENK